jgi:HNH endonuclease
MRVHYKLWQQVFERDNGICQYCDADILSSFSTYWSATVDHVLAVSVGGEDTLENLKLSCTGCNGLLSRSGALITFEDRKALVIKRIAEEHNGFTEWRKHLGRDTVS